MSAGRPRRRPDPPAATAAAIVTRPPAGDTVSRHLRSAGAEIARSREPTEYDAASMSAAGTSLTASGASTALSSTRHREARFIDHHVQVGLADLTQRGDEAETSRRVLGPAA